jgi:hypothetical protein
VDKDEGASCFLAHTESLKCLRLTLGKPDLTGRFPHRLGACLRDRVLHVRAAGFRNAERIAPLTLTKALAVRLPIGGIRIGAAPNNLGALPGRINRLWTAISP